MKDLLLIIPAYNEEATIGKLLDQLCNPEFSELADVLVVDDGSKDRTYEIVSQYKVSVVRHVYNLGYGSALQSGYKYADRFNYKYVIQMDADGQHDICNIKRIYEALLQTDSNGKQTDIVLGSRFMKGSDTFPVSVLKMCAIHLFGGIIRLTTRKNITDPTTGLQGLSRRVVSYYAGFNHFDNRYPDANILMQMLLLGFRVTEIPAVMHPRTEGVSMHSGFEPILYMIRISVCMVAAWIRVKLLKIDVEAAGEEII
jgi:glycosyltransferase involved in cell wall biosynthesis